MRIKLKNARPQAKRGRRVGDEDDLLAYLMNRNQSIYSPNGGYQVDFAPAEQRDYQAVGLPGAQIIEQAPNAQARYVNQLATQISQQQGVGNNNDYYRLVPILNEIVKDKRNLNEDGSLNKQGWANLVTQQFYGPGSHYNKSMNDTAKNITSTLAKTALLPYMAGIGGLGELAVGTFGGAIGANIGSELGHKFNNPYTGNYAGSELGGLLGGIVGGAAGANVRGLGRAYIRGMDNLANKQDLYWASRGYKLNGTQPSAAEINNAFPLKTEVPAVDASYSNNGVTIIPNETRVNSYVPFGTALGVPFMGMPIRQIPGRGMLGSLRGHLADVGRRLMGRSTQHQPAVVQTETGPVLVDNYDPFAVSPTTEAAEATLPTNLGRNSIKSAEQYNENFGNTNPTTLTPKQVMEYNNAIGHKGRLNPKRMFGFDGRKTPIHLLSRWYRKNSLISKIMDGGSTSRMPASDLFKAIKQGNKGLNKGYGSQLMEDATNAARKELATRIVRANPQASEAVTSQSGVPMAEVIENLSNMRDAITAMGNMQRPLSLPYRPSIMYGSGKVVEPSVDTYSSNYKIYNPDGNNRAIQGTAWREFIDPSTGEVRRINYKKGGTIRRRLESGGQLSY